MYGIWNKYRKQFQFGICEPSKKKAIAKLFNKIGNDARRWTFVIKKLPKEVENADSD